jgi:hypothetical protein
MAESSDVSSRLLAKKNPVESILSTELNGNTLKEQKEENYVGTVEVLENTSHLHHGENNNSLVKTAHKN